jgi:hypothetical protein
MLEMTLSDFSRNVQNYLDDFEHNDDIVIARNGEPYIKIIPELAHDTLMNNRQAERRKKFARFCGVWTEEDALEFDEAVKDFKSIDMEDWQ